MPKVLRIINRLNLGGPTYNASYLSKYMEDKYETLLVSGMHDETEASSEFIAESMGLKPVYIKDMHRAISPAKDRSAYKEISKIIQDFKPDIVHTHAAKSGALGRLAAYNAKVPVIVHTFHGHIFHSYFNPIKTRIFLEIERYLAKRSSKIIAISNLQKQELCYDFKVAPESKFEIVPLGFDLSRFQQDIDQKRRQYRSEYNLDDDEIAIGIVGRLVPVKNHPLFLKVLKAVSEQTSQKIRAYIIGGGEEEESIRTLANELNIPFVEPENKTEKKLLTFTSWIKDIDVAYAGLDVVMLTSFNEGTPVSLIEAQAANKPIVTTEVGGIGDVVETGKTALLSPRDDVEPMTVNLLKMIEDHQLRKSMSQNAFEMVNRKFSYTRLVDDMDRLYTKLLKS